VSLWCERWYIQESGSNKLLGVAKSKFYMAKVVFTTFPEFLLQWVCGGHLNELLATELLFWFSLDLLTFSLGQGKGF